MTRTKHTASRLRYWPRLLFFIPFCAMMWVPSYNRTKPELGGIPFFYWYQLGWILLGAAIVLQLALDMSLRGLFYGAQLSQPLLLGGVAIGVSLIALVATWLPVRRATRIEPNIALRSE